MHQRIVIGPATNPIKPGLEQPEFAVPKFGVEFLQQEDGGYFFFQDGAGKKLIGNVYQKIEPVFFP